MTANPMTWTTAAIVLAAGFGVAEGPSDTERQRGVSWVAGRKITALNIQPLVEDHVNWIVQTPFGWQRGIDTPRIKLSTTGGVLWGETDKGLAATAKYPAHGGSTGAAPKVPGEHHIGCRQFPALLPIDIP